MTDNTKHDELSLDAYTSLKRWFEVLWPQMSFPGGVCDAALDALVELRRHVGQEVQAAAGMDGYRDELQRLRMTATRAPRDRRV